MRLIDSCEVHAEIQRMICSDKYNKSADVLTDVLKVLHDTTTIDAKPVRRGRWIEETEPDENGNVISMCNQCYHTDEHCKNIKVPYCWYCGSYMIEEGADNG